MALQDGFKILNVQIINGGGGFEGGDDDDGDQDVNYLSTFIMVFFIFKCNAVSLSSPSTNDHDDHDPDSTKMQKNQAKIKYWTTLVVL